MSLYVLTQQLREFLKRKGCPLPVEYGPVRESEFHLRPKIVFERDRNLGDSALGGKARGVYPVTAVLRIGCVCTIVAKSSRSGAAIYDHEFMAEQCAKLVILGLRECAQSWPTTYEITSIGYITPALPQEWPALVYQIKFMLDCGVVDQEWTGDVLPSVVFDARQETTIDARGVGVSSGLPGAQTRL